MAERGKYIVIEGHDGTGKGVQTNLLRERLAQGIPAVISGYIATLAVWMPSVVASAMMVLGGLLFWVTFRPSMIRHE
jgi:hypothetical protein